MTKQEKASRNVSSWQEYKKLYYQLLEKDNNKTEKILLNNIWNEMKTIEWNIDKKDIIQSMIDNIREEIKYLLIGK